MQIADPWDRAIHALTLLAIDPAGLGGIIVRARFGPVRDIFSEALTVLPQPVTKLHPTMDDDVLFDGIDLTETLVHGTIKTRKGLLGRDGTSVLAMAERSDATFAARLAISLDQGALAPLIAFDEGAEPDEAAPVSVRERLAFAVDLEMTTRDIGLLPDPMDIKAAQTQLPNIDLSEEAAATIARLSLQLGIDSGRAGLFALRAARANAALWGRDQIMNEDIEIAASLCLAHKATTLPSPPQEDDTKTQPRDQSGQTDANEDMNMGALDDRVLDAVLAALPDGLLDQFRPKGTNGRGTGAGTKHRGNRRGRPKPSRAGRISGRNRLDLFATLRSAAPWQKLRGGGKNHVKVAPSDFRIKQYDQKSDRLLIFAVDASGSAAIARLAEAKGAVEILLSDAYSRRDHVCLVSFRGDSAETLLPPTRSLVQTKKRLAALPGGGGTPLAAGLIEALTLAHQGRNHGMTPCIVLLTDGRANVALDGTADRAAAAVDATAVARQIQADGTDTITLDLGNRPSNTLAELATTLGGLYVPLPRADSARMSNAVASALAT